MNLDFKNREKFISTAKSYIPIYINGRNYTIRINAGKSNIFNLDTLSNGVLTNMYHHGIQKGHKDKFFYVRCNLDFSYNYAIEISEQEVYELLKENGKLYLLNKNNGGRYKFKRIKEWCKENNL